ncbi:MAG: dicarboxylate/amino acid:cation symporter [Sinobacteraceae bacterium]|nr:dicarboxylate/amino acid:cation symporter [Nevskiaceae bacterium]
MTLSPPRLHRTLYFWVLVAIGAGVLLGVLQPQLAVQMKPLGDGFIKLIKMLIAPIIFCTVVTGIAGMEKLRQVGRTGGLALLYFEVMTTVALIVGLCVVNLLRPGAGLNIDVATLDTSQVGKYTGPGKLPGVVEFLLNIIPDTFAGAFSSGEVLQVLLLALLFGFALHAAGGRDSIVYQFVERLTQVLFAIVNIVMKAAPLGAFGAMAFAIGEFGVHALASLGKLLGCFYLTCVLFVLVVLGTVARLHGFSILRFVRYIREELLIVLGTSSSESALPRLIARLEALGVQKSVVGLVIPTGYSFNLDGTCIYLTLAAVFIAQATNSSLDLQHQLGLLLVLLLASKGAAGVTGSGFIVLAATLAAVGNVPVAGVVLILGIDRFMSEARALTNLVGNGVATLVVARWCGQLDVQKLQRELAAPGAQLSQAGATSLPH